MTLTLLHERIKFAENMSIDILASKFMVVISAFLSNMFDVGDLPVLTFGNCVLKS